MNCTVFSSYIDVCIEDAEEQVDFGVRRVNRLLVDLEVVQEGLGERAEHTAR